MIDHNIERFYITMHYAVGVSILKSLQDFKCVKTNIHRVELVVKLLGFYVWDVLKHETRRFSCGVSQHVVQLNDVRTSKESLQNLGLSINFLSADWFQDFNNAGLVVVCIHALEYLGVLASPQLLLYLVVVHFVPRHIVFIVVRIVLWSFSANVLVRPCE